METEMNELYEEANILKYEWYTLRDNKGSQERA